ncbi:MAG: S1C family serine protease [Planctomycetaceae bacterium]
MNVIRTTTLLLCSCCLTAAFADDAESRAANGLFRKVVAQTQKRTVKIYGAGVGRAEGYCTGIVVSPSGHILTANSVILSGERLRVVMSDGKVHSAHLKRRDTSIQTALLKIDAATPNHFKLAEKLPAAKGDWVLSASNAFKVADGEEPLSLNLGIVSLVTRVQPKHGVSDVQYDGDAVLIDAITSNPGAPGGAVVTVEGKLVGMIGRLLESKRTKTRLNYAVPAPLLARFLAGRNAVAAAKTGGNASGPPKLGIRLFRLGGKRAPAYVDRVTKNSPAAHAGIRADDLVLALGGKRVRNVADFDKLLKSLTATKIVEVLVKRKQKLLRFRLKVGRNTVN